MSHHGLNLAKFPGLENLDARAYDRGFACGYKSGAKGKNAPRGLATVRAKLTTGHGTGFRHGYIQGTRDRKEGKVK